MIGRAIYQNPYFLVDIERKIFKTKNLPTREELIARFASMLSQPMSNLASVLNATMDKLAGTLKSLEEQKQ